MIRIDVQRYRALTGETKRAFDAWMRANDVPKERTFSVSIDGDTIEAECFSLDAEGKKFTVPGTRPGTRDAAKETITLPLRSKLPGAVLKAVA